MNDTEIISDDDVEELVDKIIDVEKAHNASRLKISKRIETIVIDDEQPDNNNITHNVKDISLDINKIYNENKLLAQFIEKCLNLEISDGMLRIIKRTLLRIYNESDKNYKTSPEFERLLQKQINNIEIEPHRKFNHIKTLVEALKTNGVKKRVKLTTLATHLKQNINNTLQNKRPAAFGERIVKRSKKDEIIDLDSEPNDVPVINLDDDQNDVIMLDEPIVLDDEKENLEIPEVNHEVINEKDDNYCTANSQNDSEDMFLTPQIEVIVPNNLSEQQSINGETVESHINHNGRLDNLLSAENTSRTEEDECRNVDKEIRRIESQIEKCKQIIEQLDEAEVENDSLNSPYILSEKVKAQIVKLYKKLCELTGSESVKMRTVRLQVQEGHPAGPVRRLEEFINNNLGEDGDPMFPDFNDVTVCVLEANKADKLGWSRAQVLREASALFTQCGRALQKRRQRREWRDLLATVKTEALEYDPADDDPALAAKLEENRRLAHCKETALLDRYSRMQDMPAQSKAKQPHPVTQNGIRIVDSNENINVPNETHRNAGNNQTVPVGNNGNHELIAPNVVETDGNSLNYTQNSIVIIKTEVSVEFEAPETNPQTPSESKESSRLETGEDIIPSNLQTPTDSKESILKNLLETTGDILPCSQRLQMDEDEFRHQIKTAMELESEGRQCTKDNDPNSPLESSSLETSEDIIPSNLQTPCDSKESIKSLFESSGDIIPYSQRLQMDEDGFRNRIKTALKLESEGSQCTKDNDPNSSLESLPNCELTNSKDNEENGEVEDNVNKEASNIGDQEQEDVAKDITDNGAQNGAGDSAIVNEGTNNEVVRVKKEPVDISALLEGLGDNFSVDIVDIEDPSLVIEISDSSDEE